MNVGELKHRMEDLPDDMNIVLSKVFVYTPAEMQDKDDYYELVVDFPFTGIAIGTESNEMRFVMESPNYELDVFDSIGHLIHEETGAKKKRDKMGFIKEMQDKYKSQIGEADGEQ